MRILLKVMRLFEVPPGKSVAAERESFGRDTCYVALDKRKQYMIISQRPATLRRGISEELKLEEIALTSIYDASKNRIRKGCTGFFVIPKMTCEKLLPFTLENAGQYERVFVAAAEMGCWQVDGMKIVPK